MGINRMQGTPWHIERFARGEDDTRRHQSRCVYYSKKDKKCRCRSEKCIGSAHCVNYIERDKNERTDGRDIGKNGNASGKGKAANKRKNSFGYRKKAAVPKAKVPGSERYTAGKRVKHKFFGDGTVTKSDGKKISVRFDNGSATVLDLKTCMENGFLTLIE